MCNQGVHKHSESQHEVTIYQRDDKFKGGCLILQPFDFSRNQVAGNQEFRQISEMEKAENKASCLTYLLRALSFCTDGMAEALKGDYILCKFSQHHVVPIQGGLINIM